MEQPGRGKKWMKKKLGMGKKFEVGKKLEAVSRLVALICATHGNSGPETQETPQLELLWSMCSDDDTATSLTCSAALVGLVQRSQIDFIQAVTKLVNLAPSARYVGYSGMK
ncbi:hypothetical protein LSAT2_016164 [Lamellibrachia satsuma]|nr:hypothetical protein LSAT2_016164 [Lamellibrachia satsuma]